MALQFIEREFIPVLLGGDINASCGQLRRNYEAEKPKEGSGMDGSMGTDGHGKRA